MKKKESKELQALKKRYLEAEASMDRCVRNRNDLRSRLYLRNSLIEALTEQLVDNERIQDAELKLKRASEYRREVESSILDLEPGFFAEEEIFTETQPSKPSKPSQEQKPKTGGMTEEARKRISDAQKRRWAARNKAAEEEPVAEGEDGEPGMEPEPEAGVEPESVSDSAGEDPKPEPESETPKEITAIFRGRKKK